jgi:hypothetical protein
LLPVSEFWATKTKTPRCTQPSTITAFTEKTAFSELLNLPFFPQTFRDSSWQVVLRFGVALFMETGNQASPNKGETKMENTAKKGNAPTHNLVIGEDRQVGRKIVTYWTKVGAAWAHEDGKLFIRIRPGISVSGQIAVFPIEKKVEADAPGETAVQESEGAAVLENEVPY